jgi:hypothetical protein
VREFEFWIHLAQVRGQRQALLNTARRGIKVKAKGKFEPVLFLN